MRLPKASTSRLPFIPLPPKRLISTSSFLRLNPKTRTTLTNLSFYTVALTSILIVSLSMSGVGPAARLPCPVRSDNQKIGLDSEGKPWIIDPIEQKRLSKQEEKMRKRRASRNWLEDPQVMVRRVERK